MSLTITTATARSPRYPRVSLKDSIEHARTFYRGVHRSLIDTNSAYRVLGFSGKSGSSATALGALRQFGLVDGLRGDLRISDLALRILEPASDYERATAFAEAAKNPEVFQKIFAQFDGMIPNSDEPIRSYLIRMLDFSPSGADDCISSLRETLAFVGEMSAADTIQAVRPEREYEKPKAEALVDYAKDYTPIQSQNAASSVELARIPLSRNCTAEIRITGEVTAEGIDRLIAYLHLMKGVWLES